MPHSSINLPPVDQASGHLNVIIDTPKGSRNKFKYDEDSGLFKLSGVLPVGASFPFDFGYLPSTLGDDGDPLDVLVLMDEPAFVGCLVVSKVIGVLEAEQTEGAKTDSNDRLIAVASVSRNHSNVRFLGDLHVNLIKEIEHFFVSYNQVKGKEFVVKQHAGPERAKSLIKAGEEAFLKARGVK